MASNNVNQSKSQYECACMFVILITIITLYNINISGNILPIFVSINRTLKDNYTVNVSNTANLSLNNHCELVVEGAISTPIAYYLKDTFELSFVNINHSHRGYNAWLFSSQVDIYNNIDKNLRIEIGNEMCDPLRYHYYNTQKYGSHSTVIAHWYYDEKKDGNNGNMVPMYIPNFFKGQFSDNFETDILPFLGNVDGYQWNNRTYMILILHGVHNSYRRSMTGFLNENIANNRNYKSFVKIIRGWAQDNTKRKWLNTTQYRNVLLKSKFTLCIYGNTPETFRLWESMASGSIPIISVKNKSYFKRKCRLAYNGLLLYRNVTLKQIEHNRLIWNETNWYYEDLDVNKLLYMNVTRQFIGPILLKSDYDLKTFLDFVALNKKENPQKSNMFWNMYQLLMNQWFIDYMEYKINELKTIMLSQIHSNCSFK